LKPQRKGGPSCRNAKINSSAAGKETTGEKASHKTGLRFLERARHTPKKKGAICGAWGSRAGGKLSMWQGDVTRRNGFQGTGRPGGRRKGLGKKS